MIILKRISKQALIDTLLISVSIMSSYVIYYLWKLSEIDCRYLVLGFLIILTGRLITNKIFHIYNQIWRYINYRDLLRVVVSVVAFSFVMLLTNILMDTLHLPVLVSKSIILIELKTTMIMSICARLLRRYIFEIKYRQNISQGREYKNTLLIGAGEAGQQVLREIRLNPYLGLKVLGFLDDSDRMQGSIIKDVSILGKVEDIFKISKNRKLDLIIICIPSATSAQLKVITSLCAKTSIETKVLPSLSEVINGRININQMRDIDIADLLSRNEIKFDFKSVKYLCDEKILVTGAGGSIGSELCRQIAKFNPKELIILGRGENSIYQINEELMELYPDLKISPVIGDVKDSYRMEQILKSFKPDTIFHAAAHKHVPLMELHPAEAVLNNIMGTLNIAELAGKYKVSNFILISTDKAVNSTNIMGASKRAAELIIQSLSHQIPSTRYTAVRFGNVLDSRGSVVPKFKSQIAKGGPVTVTHPEITRYFMTIPEAVQLVIQAGNLGHGGEIFVLDMGKPVKIVDLARDLIVLSGKIPDVDIKIEFTGLRPGEKIYEELLTAEEGINATCHDQIFVAPLSDIDSSYLRLQIRNLKQNALLGNNDEIRRIFKDELKILTTENILLRKESVYSNNSVKRI